MRETLESLKQLLKKEIKKVTDKGDMTPSEVESITKAMCLYEMVEERLMLESGYDGFSADGYSQKYYHDNASMGMADPYVYGNSYARMRSPRTGRFTSHDMGRSGHSVNDRMIAALEQMVDQAGSDYERQQIIRQIEKMRGE